MSRLVSATLISLFCMAIPCYSKEYTLTSPAGLNHGLRYIFWRHNLSHGGPGAAARNSVRLLPGMKLVFNYAPLTSLKSNTFVPGLSRYEMTVPRDSFSVQDYFLLSFILASGQPQTNINPDASAQFRTLVEGIRVGVEQLHPCPEPCNDAKVIKLREQEFHERFTNAILRQTFSTFSLKTARSGHQTTECDTAAEIREWFTRPGIAEFTRNRSRQDLSISFPGLGRDVLIEVYNWNPGFFNDTERQSEIGDLKSPWYNRASVVARGMGFVDVEVPVRIDGEAVSHHFPFYWSLNDMEARLGATVVGVRRRAAFLGTIGPDGYLGDITDEKGRRLACKEPELTCTNESGEPAPCPPIERLCYNDKGFQVTCRATPAAARQQESEAREGEGEGSASRCPRPPGEASREVIDCKQLLNDLSAEPYFTLHFVEGGRKFGAGAVFRVEPELKKQLLIAPGDVIMLARKRAKVSDSPEVR